MDNSQDSENTYIIPNTHCNECNTIEHITTQKELICNVCNNIMDIWYYGNWCYNDPNSIEGIKLHIEHKQ